MAELKFYVCDNYRNMANTQYIIFSLHENDFQENVFEKFLFSKLKKWYHKIILEHGSYCTCGRCNKANEFHIILKEIIYKFRNIENVEFADINNMNAREVDDSINMYYKILAFQDNLVRSSNYIDGGLVTNIPLINN